MGSSTLAKERKEEEKEEEEEKSEATVYGPYSMGLIEMF